MIAYLYDLIYVLPVLVMFVYSVGEDLKIEHMSTALFLAIAIAAIILAIRHAQKKYKVFIVGILFAGLAGLLVVEIFTKSDWLFVNGKGIFIILLADIIACELMRVIIKREKTLLTGLALVVGLGVAALVTNQMFANIAAAAGFFLIMLFVIEEIQIHWTKSGDTNREKHLVSTVPFLLIISIVLAIVKVPEEPYDWAIFINAWNKTSEAVSKYSHLLFQSGDEYGKVDFSEDGEMAGFLGNENKLVLTLSGGNQGAGNIYLSGKVFDSFDGRKWSATSDIEYKGRMLDAQETRCASKTMDNEQGLKITEEDSLTIKYELYNTKTVFLPQKAFIKGDKVDDIRIDESPAAVIARKRIEHGSELEVSYMWLDTHAEETRVYLANPKVLERENWESNRTEMHLGTERGYSYKDYLEYRQQITKAYGQPVRLSPEVKALVAEITAGVDSDYEKLKLIEGFLQGLNYDTRPGGLPETINTDEAFLDYFLLQSKEGYCVHFATTMVLLARYEGLPARYVQGYIVEKNTGEPVEVNSDMAHAWPEVYFENVGWISFEPTPGYYRQTNIYHQQEGYSQAENLYLPTNIGQENVDGAEVTVEEKENTRTNPVMFIIPIAGIVLFVIIYVIVCRIIYVIKYRHLDIDGRMKLLCHENMRILRHLGYSLGRGETLAEFAFRNQDEFSNSITLFLSEYESISYGSGSACDKQLEVAVICKKELISRIKKKNILYAMISNICG